MFGKLVRTLLWSLNRWKISANRRQSNGDYRELQNVRVLFTSEPIIRNYGRYLKVSRLIKLLHSGKKLPRKIKRSSKVLSRHIRGKQQIKTKRNMLFGRFSILGYHISSQIIQKAPHESVMLAKGCAGGGPRLWRVSQKKDRSVLISKLGFAQIRIESRERCVFDVASLWLGDESFQWKDFFHLLSLCT